MYHDSHEADRQLDYFLLKSIAKLITKACINKNLTKLIDAAAVTVDFVL